ncbi:MAG TPA: hypothetical protein VF510_20770 [Ktedonobacterales bacterium]
MANDHDNDMLRAMRDLLDAQLQTADGVRIGRIADVEAEWRDDGALMLMYLLTGPQALAGRVASRLVPLARFIFRDRFERRIPMSEVVEIGLTVRLRGNATEYPVGQSDRWLANHIVRFIPGSGA